MASFMVWTAPQKYLLSLLDRFGALKERQALSILKQLYPRVDWEGMLIPLLSSHALKREDEYLLSPTDQICTERIAAIDLMLLLKADLDEPFFSSPKPLTMTFFKIKEGKLWRYDICPVQIGKEMQICAQLEAINPKDRKIVFLIEAEKQMQELWVPCEHCFAIGKDGKFEFYKVEGNTNGI